MHTVLTQSCVLTPYPWETRQTSVFREGVEALAARLTQGEERGPYRTQQHVSQSLFPFLLHHLQCNLV